MNENMNEHEPKPIHANHARAVAFRDAHALGCTLMPNAWDAGSARMLEGAGFPYLLTTSAGIAFSLGRPDYAVRSEGGGLDRSEMLARVSEIASAVDVPVSADLEAGYGDCPDEVAETIRLAIGAGVVGANLEDLEASPDPRLYSEDVAAARIAAARSAADELGLPFTLNARTDVFLMRHPDALAEAIRRGNRYREAGADCIFVPGAAEESVIASLVTEIDAPLNVVMGLTGNALTMSDLERLGVRRISIGGSLARATFGLIDRAATAMREAGTFGFADGQLSQDELNRRFST